MMLISAIEGVTAVLSPIANAAVRALALACGAGLGLAGFRVKAASWRLFTWTAVLYAAIALPLLGWLLPPLPIPTHAFLSFGNARVVANELRRSQPLATEPSPFVTRDVARNHVVKRTSSSAGLGEISATSQVIQAESHAAPPIMVTPVSSASTLAASLAIHWRALATAIYLCVAILLWLGLLFSRRLMRSSRSIHDPRVTVRLASRAWGCQLAFVPSTAESELISVPVTMGALRSTILLPTAWREWSDTKLDAVVAHEVSHVARRDALTQRLSLLHRAVFWFSPLAWWLNLHLADLAEQASDEAALSCGADRNDYARTLLGFFEALHSAPGRVWWQGVSMAKAGQAEKRLERILAWRGAVTVSLKKPIAVAMIAVAIPVVYLAASVCPSNNSSEAQHPNFAQYQTPPPTPRPAPAAQESTPASEATPPPEPSAQAEPVPAPVAITGTIGRGVSSAPVAPVPPITGAPTAVPIYPPNAAMAPIPPMAPVGWRAQSSGPGSSSSIGFSYHYGDDDEQRFVIVTGKSDSLTMSGSMQDARHVRGNSGLLKRNLARNRKNSASSRKL